MYKFWMVIREGNHSTSREHETRELAIEEAKRLCKKEGDKFFILEAVAAVFPEIPPIKVLDLIEAEQKAEEKQNIFEDLSYAKTAC